MLLKRIIIVNGKKKVTLLVKSKLWGFGKDWKRE